MELRTLSATALETAIECPARFEASNINRAADTSNDAARVGISVHGALECYVRATVMESHMPQNLSTLIAFYKQEYDRVFGALDMASELYKDGLAMLKTWHSRTSFDDCEVLLLETKESFPVKVPGRADIPFNYVFDRLDYLGDDEYRVVDYKTVRANLTHEQLRRKLQARVYGLAAQIRHKDAKRIFVEFDLLRHDRIGVVYTRDENADTWRLIKGKTQELWATEEAEERLNPNCRYCVRKSSCKTLQSNVLYGGIERYSTSELIDMRLRLDSQSNGIKSLLEDIDERILTAMEESETLVLEGDALAIAEVAVSSRRSVTDPSAIAEIVGAEIASRYGNFRISDIDAMLKDENLTPEQVRKIRKYIVKSGGQPRVTTRLK